MKYCIALFLWLIPFFAPAQKQGQSFIDSLLKEIPHCADDTGKVKVLDLLSFTYANIDPDRGIQTGQQALDLSVKIGWKKGVARALTDLGINYEAKSDHTLALEYYRNALTLFKDLGDEVGSAGVLADRGLVQVAQGNYPLALESDFKALSIHERYGSKKKSAMIMENIGIVYFEQKDYAMATKYYSSALAICDDLGDKESVARNFGNEGIVLAAQGEYVAAAARQLAALKIHRELGNTNSIQINIANLGNVYCWMKDYRSALRYQVEALHMSEQFGNRNGIAINLGNIGETYLYMAKDTTPAASAYIRAERYKVNLDNAVSYLQRAVNICTETKFLGPLIEFSQYLSDAYFLSGNYKHAYESMHQYTITKDSVFSLQKKMQIAGMEVRRLNELRDNEILIKDKQIQINSLVILRKQAQQRLYMTCIVLLLVVVVWVIRSLYAYKRHLEGSEKKYSDLFHLNPQPMLVIDPDTLQFLDVNAAAVKNYGYSHEEFLTMTLIDIKPATEMPVFKDVVAKYKAEEKFALKAVYRHQRKSTETIQVETQSSIIQYKGKTARVIIANDITERLTYIAKIENQNAKLMEIAWMQSHVVRAPLARIIGLVDLIEAVELSDAEEKEVLGYILSSANELDEVIRAICYRTEA